MIAPEHLATLAAIQRTGSVGGAAQELGYTPSAISQQVRRLERQVGSPVLDRIGRGVMLTELGRHLVDEGAAILRQLEALETGASARTQGAATGSLRLAAFSTAIRGLVAPALTDLRATAPGLDIGLVETEPGPALDLVATGGVDAAIVHSWGELPLTVPEHVEFLTLGYDVADVLVHADHPLATTDSVSPDRLADEPWVCAPVGSVCHGWLTHMFAQHGLRPDIRHWALEFSSHIGLVAEGVCVSLVPRLGREQLPARIVALALCDPVPTRRVVLAWRRSMAPSPALSALRAALTQSADHRLDPTPG